MRKCRTGLTLVVAMLLLTSCASSGSGNNDLGGQPERDGQTKEWEDLLGSSRPLPSDHDLETALAYFQTVSLPSSALPQGLIEIQALRAGCVEHFGFPMPEDQRDAAFKTGMFMYVVDEQMERADEALSACEIALYESGVLMGSGREANQRLYEIYLESQECLQANGFPTVEPPTAESFAEQPWAWYPWEAMLPIGTGFTPHEDFMHDEKFRPYVESLEVCPRP